MKKSIVSMILLLSLTATLFAGCGSSSTATSETTVSTETSEAASEVTSEAVTEAVTETTEAATAEGTVTVTDAKGEVEIPASPQRIVDLSGNSDVLSILGMDVVGTANSDAYDYTKFPTYLEETLAGATILGYSYQDTMDVEKIMSLEPDLIIISSVQEKMYDQLTAIAPTVMIQLAALNWKDDMMTIAGIFGKEAEATDWLTAYEAKATEIGTQVKTTYGEDTSYLSFLASGGQFYVFDGAGFGSVMYEDMGLAKPVGMPEQADVSLPVVTYEGLASIEADYIFVMAADEDWDALITNAIWNKLPAVESGQVIHLPASPYFNQGYSPVGRNLLLDEFIGLIDERE
ncbi:MAG: ABC transporter substrate-binding protein [Lachnospiraceae bacterium]